MRQGGANLVESCGGGGGGATYNLDKSCIDREVLT